ncbi:probable COQ5 - ubiquinone biosynthesis, methyltransferase [Melanopsichium pennsylvanicum]|uniref:2-methoxy-6-polyprenyl-1,4-benzoquinol methylase, mitochondrial n=2 Tax=Melanopsichium pennsylvanicum TaxID=63383 RepID=A0AAJ5C3C1_9BASI|nr:probable COQ5-ubiquinone biosynthesis, methyltransferase [Melanopsichium pennsylvanicum 4]SNX82471.1 probable COQ5 - ubiquinone biosynthesis, methyltransferase [Melanopsichium pennsylvanicum]
MVAQRYTLSALRSTLSAAQANAPRQSAAASSRNFLSTPYSRSDRPPTGSFPPSSHQHNDACGSASNTFSSRSTTNLGYDGSASESKHTHFGFRTVAEEEKESMVASVFSSVASKYDVMNDAMSLGIHRLWKDHFVSKLDPRGGIKVLDVAGGTGDIALRILDHARTKHFDRETHVTVLDINPSMLKEGQKRFKQTMYWGGPQVSFQLGNAEQLDSTMEVPPEPVRGPNSKQPYLPPLESKPIPDESIDLFTMAFGIRNCTHIDEVLKQAHRVLKPGGVFSCLEFGKVNVPFLAEAYKQYSFNILPPLGQMLAGDRSSYQYLVESIERFPTQPQFARMMKDAGFHLPGSPTATSLGFPAESGNAAGAEDVAGAWEDLTFGVATIWTGIKL